MKATYLKALDRLSPEWRPYLTGPIVVMNLTIALATMLCAVFLIARVRLSGEFSFGFLIWNLFLAVLPYVFALWVLVQSFRSRLTPAIVVVALLWFFFLPNAPYILTDAIHLRDRAPVPIWFDALLIFLFAWTGLFAGAASLRFIHCAIARRLGHATAWGSSALVILICGLGVYIGRYLRYNSWDVLYRMHVIVGDVIQHFQQGGAIFWPIVLAATVTILFGLHFLALYAMAPRLETQLAGHNTDLHGKG